MSSIALARGARSGVRGQSSCRLYGKHTHINGILADVGSDAQVAVAGADRLVFVGYSIPPTDIEAEKMFQRALTNNKSLATIEIVNPDPASAARYATLFPRPLRWFPGLAAYVASEW